MLRTALSSTLRRSPRFPCICAQRRLALGMAFHKNTIRTLTTDTATRPLKSLLQGGTEADEAAISQQVTEWLNARYSAPIDIPGGWSNEWDKYDHLYTLFWPSPYPLKLRQMEMVINVQHRIKGEIIPLLYCVTPTSQFGKDAFLFEISGGEEVYIYDIEGRKLFKFEVEDREDAIMHLMVLHDARVSGGNLSDLPLTPLAPDSQGSKILHRILNNDETVKDALKEGAYLPYAI